MTYYILKLFLSAAIVVTISEVSKRSSLMGGFIASLPLVSLLGMLWLYWDTKDATKVADLSMSIFWFVLPSLPFFVALPFFIRNKFNLWTSLSLSALIMAGCYLLMLLVLKKAGIKL